jgi:hypothetical protein
MIGDERHEKRKRRNANLRGPRFTREIENPRGDEAKETARIVRGPTSPAREERQRKRQVKNMKLIEAMKLIKELQIKADDLRGKVKQYCADLDFETPMYPDQKRQVSEWIQAHSDILKEILKLRVNIQRTNLSTIVEIFLGGDKPVSKTIAEWIHRRRDLANAELLMWQGLTDKNLKEGQFLPVTSPGVAATPVKLRRYYDPQQRDEKVVLYRAEPGMIDRKLEVVNATTDLIEA